MVGWTVFILTLILTLLRRDVFCQSADDVKSLMTQLFTVDGYNKLVRPSGNQSIAMQVFTNLYLVSITDIDEVKEKMTTTAYLELIWEDWYLSWTPSDYNGIKYLLIPQSNIWKPDIALENGFSKMKELGDNFILTTVSYDGDVSWYPYEVFETKCDINIMYFPFDEQTCEIQLGVWTSTISDIYVKLDRNDINLKHYQENGEWKVIQTSSRSSISAENETLVSYIIHVKRKPEYYLYNMVLPVLFLSILSVFTFVLPVESGEKIGFCMTTFLAFAVFLTIVSAQLPASSTQSLLSKYLIFLVVIGTLIIMITAMELRINYRSTERFPIPTWLGFLFRFSMIIRCVKPCRRPRHQITVQPNSTEVDDESRSGFTDPKQLGTDIPHNSNNPEEKIEWTHVVSALDFYFFWTFLTVDVFGTIIMLANSYVQSKK